MLKTRTDSRVSSHRKPLIQTLGATLAMCLAAVAGGCGTNVMAQAPTFTLSSPDLAGDTCRSRAAGPTARQVV